MDNTIVINGHISRLETRISPSWPGPEDREACCGQADTAATRVPEIRLFPAMMPKAAQEATQEAAQEAAQEVPSAPLDAGGETERKNRNDDGRGSHSYRTAKRARMTGRIVPVPDIMAVPSLGEYRDAMTILTTTEQDAMKKRPAWLNLVLPEMAAHLTYKNDELLYDGVSMPNIDLVNYLDMTPARISETDTILLRVLYATILRAIDEELKGKSPVEILETVNSKRFLNDTVTIYVPDLVEALGGDRNSWHSARIIVDKIKGFLTLYGSIEAPLGNRMYYIYRPALSISEDDQRRNTIDIGGPHLRKLIAMIKQASMETDKKGHVKTKRDGTPFMLPSHSYMIKSTLATERNKRAAEIVCAIVPRIEQAGSRTLSISARSILEACPGLKCAFEEASTSSNKTRVLRNAFLPAWKLMRTQTRLEEFYENIRLPGDDKEKKDPTYPTAKNLDMNFTFQHDGKIQKQENMIQNAV